MSHIGFVNRSSINTEWDVYVRGERILAIRAGANGSIYIRDERGGDRGITMKEDFKKESEVMKVAMELALEYFHAT